MMALKPRISKFSLIQLQGIKLPKLQEQKLREPTVHQVLHPAQESRESKRQNTHTKTKSKIHPKE